MYDYTLIIPLKFITILLEILKITFYVSVSTVHFIIMGRDRDKFRKIEKK